MTLENLKPVRGVKSTVKVVFPSIEIESDVIYAYSAQMKGFVNNGYAFKVQLSNIDFRLLSKLIDGTKENRTLLNKIRKEPIPITIEFSHNNGTDSKNRTRKITGYIISISSSGTKEVDFVTIVALDPVSWSLRIGDAEGKAYFGKLHEAIRQVINKYAPDIIVDIDETIDSRGTWWSLRRSPIEMLSHWITIASSLNSDKVPWMIGIDGNRLKIAPQTKFESKTVGYYTKRTKDLESTIMKWRSLLNPSLGHEEMGIITAGISGLTGKYLDQITDPDSSIITDTNTQSKLIPKTNNNNIKSTIRPEVETFRVNSYGRQFIESLPEYVNNNDNIAYKEYYDAYARTKYVRDVYKLFTLDVAVVGHGVYDNTMIMGTSNVFIDWRNLLFNNKASQTYYLHGNWLVYGFKHTYTNNTGWKTILNLARPDHNALGKKIGEDVSY